MQSDQEFRVQIRRGLMLRRYLGKYASHIQKCRSANMHCEIAIEAYVIGEQLIA